MDYYTIQGEIKEIYPVEKYGIVFRNLVVGDIYVHMAKGATWSKDDIQVGDEVVVTCFNDNISDNEHRGAYICGISVTWLGDKRMTSSVLTPQEFAEKMRELSEMNYVESAHGPMDNLMCETLKALGYGEGVEIFENTDKWYA